MGTNLQVQNLSLEDFGGLRFEGCNENLLITRPDAVEKVHTAFLDVGCDVIETNSFNGTPVDFAEYDMADQAYDMNVRAATSGKTHRRRLFNQRQAALGRRFDGTRDANCRHLATSPLQI